MRRVLAVVLVAATITMVGSAASQEPAADLQDLVDATPTGGVLTLEAGIYRGGVLIDRPLTLQGVGWPVVDAGGEGTAIEVRAPDVTISGLVIANTGASLDRENAGVSAWGAPRLVLEDNRFEDVLFGMFLRESPDSVVRGNTVGAKDVDIARRGDGIRVWESHRTLVEGNTVVGGRDSVMWFSDDLVIRDNHVSDGRYGLHFMYSDRAVIERNVLEGNSVGAFLMYSRDLVFTENHVADSFGPSGYGMGLKDMDGVEARGNRFVGNRIGVYFDNSPMTYGVSQHFTDNLIAFNEVGLEFLPSVKGNVFSGNGFLENREQVGVVGGGRFDGNQWTADGTGNYWDDFAGYDADADGLGDIPYRLDDLYSALTDDHPELTFFAETPAATAVDMAARMFPTFRPRPKVVDDAPLIDLPTVSGAPSPGTPSSAALLGVSAAMVAVAGIVVGAGRKLGTP